MAEAITYGSGDLRADSQYPQSWTTTLPEARTCEAADPETIEALQQANAYLAISICYMIETLLIPSGITEPLFNRDGFIDTLAQHIPVTSLFSSDSARDLVPPKTNTKISALINYYIPHILLDKPPLEALAELEFISTAFADNITPINANAIFVLGLPGSGKTELTTLLRQYYEIRPTMKECKPEREITRPPHSKNLAGDWLEYIGSLLAISRDRPNSLDKSHTANMALALIAFDGSALLKTVAYLTYGNGRIGLDPQIPQHANLLNRMYHIIHNMLSLSPYTILYLDTDKEIRHERILQQAMRDPIERSRRERALRFESQLATAHQLYMTKVCGLPSYIWGNPLVIQIKNNGEMEHTFQQTLNVLEHIFPV